MSPATRATKISGALYQTVGTVGKGGSRLRRASEISLTTPGLDLATRLRVFQRALRSRVERRDALLDIVRAVNATLEPPKIADLILDRSSTWVPAVYALGGWVMPRGQECVTNYLADDSRVTDPTVGSVIAFPLSGRGR